MDVDTSPLELEYISNDLYSDDEHHQMDKAVTQALNQKYQPEPHIFTLAIVLHSVVIHDEQLDRKYHDAATLVGLFDKHPLLKFKVEEAWQNESYCSIRKLGKHTNHD